MTLKIMLVSCLVSHGRCLMVASDCYASQETQEMVKAVIAI